VAQVVVPEDAVRAALRAGWQRSPDAIESLSGGPAAPAWLVDDHVLVRVPADRRAQLEAGCGAALHLAGRGLDVAAPLRTHGGTLAAIHDGGAYALARCPPGRPLDGADPLDQQWWGDLLGRAHRALDGFAHHGLVRWHWVRPEATHLAVAPWLRPAVAGAVAALTRLSVTDRLTYGVLHGDPLPAAFRLDPQTGATGLLHWGYAATGPLVFDLASAVVHAGGAEGAGELVDGYASAGPVQREEIDAALPVLLRFRWAAQADWHARGIAADPSDPSAVDGLERARLALAAFES
jgi:homoserine kinase type II